MPTPLGYAHFQVIHKHTNDEDPWLVTFATTTDLGSFSTTDHCNHVMAVFGTEITSGMTSSVSLLRVQGYFGNDGSDDTVGVSDLTAMPGSSPAAKLPSNCALLIQKRTGLAGRKHRGRMFVPNVLSETAVGETGVIDTTTVGQWQTRADDLLSGLMDTNGGINPALEMVILHSDGSTPTPVTELRVDPLLATQRRRLR